MEITYDKEAIAVIGMAGRFPGARTVNELWNLLISGRESLCLLSEAQLLAAGVSNETLRSTGYIKASMRLDDIELFDAGFFGYSPRQAAEIDPQQRLFLECAW